MDIIEAINKRRSVRRFLSRDMEREDIERILAAGMLAPSAKNRQPWRFVVVRGAAKQDLCAAMRAGIVREKNGESVFPHYRDCLSGAEQTLSIMQSAPVIVCVLNEENTLSLSQSVEEKFAELCNVQSIGAAIENMLLAALEYDLAGLWIADICFAYEELRAWLGTERELVAAVAFGYPDERPAGPPRKRPEELTEWRT